MLHTVNTYATWGCFHCSKLIADVIVTVKDAKRYHFGLVQSHILDGLILCGHSFSVSDILLLQNTIIRTIRHGPFSTLV